MMEQPVLIPQGDDLLAADFLPNETEAVLLLPGWGGTRYGPQRILVHAAHKLAALGFTTLRLDFRGRGDSTGDARTVTLDGMIADARAAVDWLQNRQGISTIAMVGLCSGGNVALGAASQLTGVKHLVCWSLLPFMEHKQLAEDQGTHRGAMMKHLLGKALQPEAWKKLLRGEANVKGAVQTLAKDKEGNEEERERKRSSRDILAELAANFSGRMHLAYGSRDPEAAGSHAFFESWCQAHNIPVDVRIIDGAPHNFYTAKWTYEVVEQTINWIGETERLAETNTDLMSVE